MLGKILQEIPDINLTRYGVDIQLLLSGNSELSYDEMQLILTEIPATRVLAQSLKVELLSSESVYSSCFIGQLVSGNMIFLLCMHVFHSIILLNCLGLEEERLYQVAMKNDHKVSLSYMKILALGPGQVGKSTFLYRLMGLEKLPQCSTGIAELHEAFISYSSSIGALTEDSWQVFDKGSDLKSQLRGLIHLLIEQAPSQLAKKHLRKFIKATELKEPSTVNPKAMKIDNTAVIMKEKESLKPVLQEIKEEVVKTEVLTIHETLPLSSTSTVVGSLPPRQSNIDKVVSKFESIKTECMLGTDKMKFHTLFNIADVGGQPAFLEMLPSLTIGPALYLVFMKLLQGLKTRYEVAFKCNNERG